MCMLRLERLLRIADDCQPRELAERRRSQIISTIDVTVDAASIAGRFIALTNWLADMRVAMADVWSDTVNCGRWYPAFQKPLRTRAPNNAHRGAGHPRRCAYESGP